MLTLRPYQEDAVTGIDTALADGFNRPVVQQATGLGKTAVAAWWIDQEHAKDPRGRTLITVHRNELAEQMRDEIRGHAPHLNPGIVMGDVDQYDRPVVIASIQTIGVPNRDGRYVRRDRIHSVKRIVVDECHRAPAPTYKDSLANFGAFHGVPCIGFTATMSRAGGGLAEIWQTIVERPGGGLWDTEWGVRNGWLVTPRGFRVRVPRLNLAGVHVRAGDLAKEEIAGLMLDADTGAAIVKAIQNPELCRCDGTDRGVVFCPDVATAREFAAEMNAAGIRTGIILGSTPKEERRQIYRQFRDGEIHWLCNAMVLTEGWNAPWVNVLIIARPTKVAALYQQMIGRGLRRFPGKTECRVLDVCGVTELHGLAGLADLSPAHRVTPRNGQSLLEALEEQDVIDRVVGGLDPWAPPRGPVERVVGTEIDLFGNARSIWLQTNAGTWFVPAGDRLFFLWPESSGDQFGLWTTPKLASYPEPIQHGLPLEIGMALAEQHAMNYAPESAGKNAPWRLSGPARAGQKRDLAAAGLKYRPGMTAAQAYDALCVWMASERLDTRNA